MAITSLGAGSGLDAESIVASLMKVEKLPLNQIKTRTDSYNAKISAFGTISGNLSALKTAAQALYATKTNLLTGTLSDTSLGTISTSTSATPGSYSLETLQLAKAHTLSSRTMAASTDTVGTGSLSISNGSNSFTVTINDGNKTLAGIRDAINANTSNTSVKANIITDANGSRLVLTSKNTGAANAINIAVTDNDGNNTDTYDALTNPNPGLSQLAYTIGANNLSQVQPAQNATIKIDSVELSFASNTIVDAIPGVTLNLTKAAPGTNATVTIGRDSAGLKTLAENFVKAYNDLRGTINKNTAYNAETKTASTLTGDSTVRSIDSQLRTALRTVPAGVTGDLTQLADIGISINASGTMELNATKFQAAIDKNFSGVQSVMDGYGKAASNLIGTLTDTNGVISARTTGMKASIKLLDDQKERLNNRLESIEQRYRARFTSLDTMIAGLKNTSSFLTQQISRF
jgi:flagellar hook-associated protein 2